MTNDILNILTIVAPTEERRNEVLATIGEQYDDKYIAISFNKIVPMPKSLDLMHGNAATEAENYIMAGRTRQLTEEKQIELKPYIDNYDQYGFVSWYGWRCKRWGTKWDSYEVKHHDDGRIFFQTAWATPTPVIAKLSEMFPDCSFEVDFADEDLGENCGFYTYKAGQLIDAGEPENACEWARELWDSIAEE